MRIASAIETTRDAVALTGERAQAPSDDPSAFGATRRLDARMGLVVARARAADQAAGDLDLAESALASASDLLVRAREIAVQMANGSMDAKARADAAKEVDSLRGALVAIGNTKGENGYVFAGLQTATVPFDANGAFWGDAGSRQVEIADGKTSTASASGALAFTALGGRDVLADLASLGSALSNNNVGAIQASIGTMDACRDQLVSARVRAGMDGAHLHDAANVMTSLVTRLSAERAQAGEVDAPTAYSSLANARAAYERAIEITRQILAQSSTK
jgi:flagellar hook-associated protein 3 FlgL